MAAAGKPVPGRPAPEAAPAAAAAQAQAAGNPEERMQGAIRSASLLLARYAGGADALTEAQYERLAESLGDVEGLLSAEAV